MSERGVSVDHSPVNGWAMKLLPVLEKAFPLRKLYSRLAQVIHLLKVQPELCAVSEIPGKTQASGRSEHRQRILKHREAFGVQKYDNQR